MLIVRDQEHQTWMLKSCISPTKVKKTVVPHRDALVDVVNLVINLIISQHLILNITLGFNWQKKNKKQRTLMYATFSPVYFTGLWTCKSASRMSSKQIYSYFSSLWSGSIFSTITSVGDSPVPFYAHTQSVVSLMFFGLNVVSSPSNKPLKWTEIVKTASGSET